MVRVTQESKARLILDRQVLMLLFMPIHPLGKTDKITPIFLYVHTFSSTRRAEGILVNMLVTQGIVWPQNGLG